MKRIWIYQIPLGLFPSPRDGAQLKSKIEFSIFDLICYIKNEQIWSRKKFDFRSTGQRWNPAKKKRHGWYIKENCLLHGQLEITAMGANRPTTQQFPFLFFFFLLGYHFWVEIVVLLAHLFPSLSLCVSYGRIIILQTICLAHTHTHTVTIRTMRRRKEKKRKEKKNDFYPQPGCTLYHVSPI